MKVLVVEDDAGLADLLVQSLQDSHYQVELAADGDDGLALTEAFDYDLVLLDLNLPKLDGISFCRQLRARGGDVPVLLMTAEDRAESKIAGLDAGADDYVTKPLDIGELLARMRALLRRGRVETSPLLEWGPISLDPRSCEVFNNGSRLELTNKEYNLLQLFLRYPNRILSIDYLIEHLWTHDKIPTDNGVRTQIKGLRRKLRSAGVQDIIETVYGLGYRLCQAPFTTTSNQPVSALEKSVEQAAQSQVTERSRKEQFPEKSLLKKLSVTKSERVGKKTVEEETIERLEAAWKKHQNRYHTLINTLEDCVSDLVELLQQSETLAEALTEQAALIERSQTIAHTLKGTLGSFGFTQAAHFAENIEQYLIDAQNINAQSISASPDDAHTSVLQIWQQLPTLIQRLREALNQPIETSMREASALERSHSPVSPVALSSSHYYRWLVIDSDQHFIDQLVLSAPVWNIQTAVAYSAQQADLIATQSTPDVVLIDPTCLETAKQKHSLLHKFKEQWPDLPVVVLSASNQLSDRIDILRTGTNCLFLQKPIDAQQLIEIVNQRVEKTHSLTEAKILALDDDPLILESLHQVLSPWGFQLTLLSEPSTLWQTLKLTLPDLIILDIEMPGINGLEICRAIRSDPRLEQVPVLFLSAHRELEIICKVFETGADDYVSKPIIGPELVARILNRLKRLRLRRQSDGVDSLTGIRCRRQSVVLLKHLLKLAATQKKTVCLAVLNLDRFKRINDYYGHTVSAQILKIFSNYLKQTFQEEDIVSRWGEEEFVVGIFDTAKASAAQRLNNLLQTFQQHTFNGESLGAKQAATQTFQISFSAGISAFPTDGKDLQTLYYAANRALHQAKISGRSQVLTTR